MDPGGSILDSQEHSSNPYPDLKPVPRIGAYFFKIHFNVALPSMPSPPRNLFLLDLPVNILKALFFFNLST